jgi:hypothetical protein
MASTARRTPTTVRHTTLSVTTVSYSRSKRDGAIREKATGTIFWPLLVLLLICTLSIVWGLFLELRPGRVRPETSPAPAARS